jgi:hypothetical protein
MPTGWRRFSPTNPATFGIVASAVVMVFLAMPFGPIAGGDPKPGMYEVLLSCASIWMFVCFGIFTTILNKTTGMRRRWQDNPALAQPHVMEASESGMKLTEPQSSHDYRWSSLRGFRETANLLLVYPSGHSFWFIPKRAFSEPAALDRFKGFLMTHIGQGQFLPSHTQAFPVLPLSKPEEK